MVEKPDEEKVKNALKAAGVIIPDDPHISAKVSAELSKHGIVHPKLTILANGNYVLVVPD